MIAIATHTFILHYEKLMNIQPVPVKTHKDLTRRIEQASLPNHATSERINSGDCGVAAMAIGLYLKRRGYDVKFFDNVNHAYFSVDGVYYDTLTPTGASSHKDMYGYYADNLIKEVTVRTLHDNYMPYDNLGVGIVDHFLKAHTKFGYPYASLDNSVKTEIINGHIRTVPVR